MKTKSAKHPPHTPMPPKLAPIVTQPDAAPPVSHNCVPSPPCRILTPSAVAYRNYPVAVRDTPFTDSLYECSIPDDCRIPRKKGLLAPHVLHPTTCAQKMSLGSSIRSCPFTPAIESNSAGTTHSAQHNLPSSIA